MTRNHNASPQKPVQLYVEFFITVLFWGVWAYVVMPLLSLLLWFAGVHVFVEQMISLGGYEILLRKLGSYGAIVLGIIICTLLWVKWNLQHYGRHNIRTHNLADVTLAETAEMAGVDETAIIQIQQARRLVLAFNETNQILTLELQNTSPTQSL